MTTAAAGQKNCHKTKGSEAPVRMKTMDATSTTYHQRECGEREALNDQSLIIAKRDIFFADALQFRGIFLLFLCP